MNYAFGIIVTLFVFLFMELVAWFTHKYVMHGFLWKLHKDHHDHSNKTPFEKNDYFFLIFAIPGFLNIFFGNLCCAFRILSTPKQTKIKAVSVPIFTISARSPKGMNPAIREIIMPVIKIILMGVCVFLLTWEKFPEIN